MKLEHHPTVKAYRDAASARRVETENLEASWIKQQALAAGAADAGLVDLDRPSMADYRADLMTVMPQVRTVLVMIFRLNPPALKSMAHSVVDLEFKQVWQQANKAARILVDRLQASNLTAVNMPAGFPYEAARWPGKMWLTCDKVLAVEAGLGQMGWNRLVLHPRLGAGVLIGSVLLAQPFDRYDAPLDFNPCIGCGLCVKVCPVGAVRRAGFDFTACYTHNYRERLGGFVDWVGQVADSKNRNDYRRRVSDAETISMWQNLSIGSQTRCDRCMAVCPAGIDQIGPFLDDRKGYIRRTAGAYKGLKEAVYVANGSDAQTHVLKKGGNKTVKVVGNGMRPVSAARFLQSLPIVFQSGRAGNLDAVYHFVFTGAEDLKGTVVIQNGSIQVKPGLAGTANLKITADSRSWVRFIAGEIGLIGALMRRKIRISGPPRLMKRFAACFPG